MATEDEVDPQWLCNFPLSDADLSLTVQGILPEKFQLTQTAKLKSFQNGELNFRIEDNFLIYLNQMATPAQKKSVGHTFIPIEEERSVKTKYDTFHAQWKQHHECMFEALCHAGLEYRGGLTEFCLDKRVRMPCILVKDAEKARKYVHIGVHIGTDIPEHPTTLEEAAGAYAKVSTLVTEYRDVHDLERIIEDAHGNEDCWWVRREIFWLKTKERYRQALLDLAKEECYENELKNLREKKRARAESA